jgi:hypothetical protein
MSWHQNEWFRRLIRSKDQWNERHIDICLCCSGLEFHQRPEFHWLKVWKNPFFIDPVFGHKNQNVASFSGRIRPKVLKTHATLIICFEVLFERIDYVECLLHALLNYLIFAVIFSKNPFSKKFSIIGIFYYFV